MTTLWLPGQYRAILDLAENQDSESRLFSSARSDLLLAFKAMDLVSVELWVCLG